MPFARFRYLIRRGEEEEMLQSGKEMGARGVGRVFAYKLNFKLERQQRRKRRSEMTRGRSLRGERIYIRGISIEKCENSVRAGDSQEGARRRQSSRSVVCRLH